MTCDAVAKKYGLILFPQEWETAAMPLLRLHFPDIEWCSEGFDLFTFPSNLKLANFTAENFVETLLRKYPASSIACVFSTHEQFGALSAALLSEQLGLPGTPVAALLTAQHKLHCREMLYASMPTRVPKFQAFHYDSDLTTSMRLPYPVFVKPVKAAFSILAKKCHSLTELQTHMRFGLMEKFIIKRLTRPFNRIARERLKLAVDGDWMIAEELMSGTQLNVDGYAVNGQVHILGTLDAVMYPGTSAFMRFQLPSLLSKDVLKQVESVAKQAVEAIGFAHGMFNVELFYQPAEQSIKIIEINPRMAGQFADLYEKVHGLNLFILLAAISLGRPQPEPSPPIWGAAASFVYREFGQAIKHAPSQAQQLWLKDFAADAQLHLLIKHGWSRAREVKWLGDYRYALLHLGGHDQADLLKRYAEVNRHLDFDQGDEGFMARWRRAV
jgi:hypothetical protein